MTNPIETAVAPLKADAQDAAEQVARKVIAKVIDTLEEAGWDAQIAAPYPNVLHHSREEYRKQHSWYSLVRRLTVSTSTSYSRSPRDPEPRKINPEATARFVVEARENAALQYDAFVAKLVNKIGETTSAELTGNHVWAHSILEVVTAAGEREVWKTRSIWNRSKLGLDYQQWPTRKLKAA